MSYREDTTISLSLEESKALYSLLRRHEQELGQPLDAVFDRIEDLVYKNLSIQEVEQLVSNEEHKER